jgi:hypothetical protein
MTLFQCEFIYICSTSYICDLLGFYLILMKTYVCVFRSLSYPCTRKTCYGALGSSDSSGLTQRRLSSHDNSGSLNCWRRLATKSDVCQSDTLQCKEGAIGPLCGSCDDGFYYFSTDLICLPCNSPKHKTIILLLAYTFIGVAIGTFYSGSLRIPEGMQRNWIFGVLQRIDTGALRVVWSNYQV